MAVAVQSTSTTAWANAATVVITKPTGLVVGDLMLAHIGVGSGTVTTPTGWTLVRTNTLTADTLKGYVFSKVATSSDVAASNFTFSLSGSLKCAGAMLRIDGFSSSIPIPTSAGDDDSNTSPPTFTDSVTPVGANSLLVILTVVQQVDSATTISGYAVVTSTPTFTEVYDFNDAGGTGSSYLLCGAYGTRAAVTATGNSTLTYSAGTNPDAVSHMIVVSPSKDFSTIDTVSITDTKTSNIGLLVQDVISVTDTITTTTARLWTKVTRNIKNWTNQNK